MRAIPLTCGLVALIDDEDLDRVSQSSWYAVVQSNTAYAKRTVCLEGKRRMLPLQNFILGRPIGEVVDHKNGNGLDNRKENLRPASKSQNCANKRIREREFPRGVYLQNGRWRAKIKHKQKIKNLGYYNSVEEAASAYNRAATELHGEFAILNPL